MLLLFSPAPPAGPAFSQAQAFPGGQGGWLDLPDLVVGPGGEEQHPWLCLGPGAGTAVSPAGGADAARRA